MGKQETVSAQKAAVLAGQDAALESGLETCYDQGAVDQKASDGTLTQADLDAAVAAAVGPLNDQIVALTAQDASDVAALGVAQAAVTGLQAQVDALTAEDAADKAVVANFQNSIAALQAALDALKAALPS